MLMNMKIISAKKISGTCNDDQYHTLPIQYGPTSEIHYNLTDKSGLSLHDIFYGLDPGNPSA